MKNGWTLYHSIKGQIKVENYIKKKSNNCYSWSITEEKKKRIYTFP